MDKEKLFKEALEYLAGSCMPTYQALDATLEYHGHKDLVSDSNLEMEFADYVEKNDCWECEICGWWNHPGEGCGPICDDCQNDQDEEEDA